MNRVLLALLLMPTLALAQTYKVVVSTNDTVRGLIGQHGSAHASTGNDSLAIYYYGISNPSNYYPASNPSNYTAYPYLTSNTTVTITNTMSSATIQGLIDAQPKALRGYTLTFDWGPGTYVLTNRITISGFLAGIVNMNGANVANIAYTTQTTILTNGVSDYLFVVEGNASQVNIRDMKLWKVSGTGVILGSGQMGLLTVTECYLVGSSTAAFLANTCQSQFVYNYINGTFTYAILSQVCGQLYVLGCAKTGSTPSYGHCCGYGGILMRGDSTALGTTDNLVTGGGAIHLIGATWL